MKLLILLGAAVLVAGGLAGGWFAQQETRDAETVNVSGDVVSQFRVTDPPRPTSRVP